MTKKFDEKNMAKSRRVCEAMDRENGRRKLTERERRILDMWPRFEDGEYVWFGDEVANLSGAITVEAIEFSRGMVCVKDAEDGDWDTSIRALHQLKRPAPKVLDADGVEIKVGDTVWTLDGLEGVVTKVEDGAAYIAYESDYAQCEEAANLTHTRPDSWERLWNDMACHDPKTEICGLDRDEFVRRAKALAGVER